MGKKIVITGALGHIGSELIRVLPDYIDCDITMIDNLLTQRYSSLFNLPKEGSYIFLENDILSVDLNKILLNADVVIHLAAITNAAGSFDKVKEVEEVNFIGTQKVIDACIKTNTKLIFLSTTSVYGTQAEEVDEDCTNDELNPQSPYAISKIKSEDMLRSVRDQLNFVILRFGTIFGFSVGMRFHTAVNKFCWQAVMRSPLTIWETAYNQKRPYLELTDATRSLIFVIKNELFNGEIYNVLTLNATVKDVVDVIKLNIRDVELNFVENRIMNQLSYEVLNKKFIDLGFKFKGDIYKSIANTIDIIKNANQR